MFSQVLFLIIFMFIESLCMLLLGFLFYGLGVLFDNIYIKRFGFRIIAYGDAPFFGAHSRWLSRNCCLNRDCSKCPYWTCLGKQEKDDN